MATAVKFKRYTGTTWVDYVFPYNHTHTKSQISDFPSIPTKTSQLTNDSNFLTNNTLYEANLKWGNKNFSGSYGPIDAAMISDLGANRLAFAKHAGITVEYSRDGGVTWLDYGATEAQTNGLTTVGSTFVIGKADSNNKATEKYMLRINLYTSAAQVYTALNKFAIYISTNGSTGSYCTIRARTQTNYLNNVDTWVVRADKVPISGWSGWNIINVASITTYGNTPASQFGHIQFIFGCTGGSDKYNGLQISRIFGFGGVGWTTPSNLARFGTIYSYDNMQNVVFPAQVRATTFTENGTSLSNKYASLANYNTLNTKVTTLIGSDSGKAIRTIANEEVAKIVANAPESFDTLKEISDWIGTHSDDAMKMDLQIQTNKNNIANLTPKVTTLENDFGTLDGEVDDLKQDVNANTGDISTLKATVKNFQDGSTAVGNSTKLNGQSASYYLNYNNLTNKPTIPSLTGYLKETTADGKYLAKTTYEYNKELSFGSTGKLLIGKFPCYDTNISIAIKSTTSTTYYGVLVIATQNANKVSGILTANVYGDASNTIATNIYIEYNFASSNVVSVYFSPSSWSKNLVHIQALGLSAVPTNLMENVSAIPSSANKKPTNVLTTTFLKTTDISSWAKASTKPSYTFSEINSKPTTIAGYGITDCKIENGKITIGSNSITPLTSHQSLANYVTLNTVQNISGFKTFLAPTNVANTEQVTTWFNTSNGGRVGFGKEGPNSGTAIFFDQVSGTRRLNFRASATAGAIVWSQPETNSSLFFDVTNVHFRNVTGLYLTNIKNAGFLKTDDTGKVIRGTFPSINNGKVIINQAGVEKGSFTLNQSGNVTIDLTDNNTTYSTATTSSNGLMSSTDKSRLDSIWSLWNADDEADTLVNKVQEVLAVFDSYPEGTTIVNALANKQDKGNYISYTLNNTVNVVGTNKNVAKISPETIYVPNGLIMGGTAAAAGLVTRGICGVSTPDAKGACTKENLYINYDGDNTYRNNRQLVLQAGLIGTHYGNNVYQYCAVRGDALKNYCDSHYQVKGTYVVGTKISNINAQYNDEDIPTIQFLKDYVSSEIPTNISAFTNDMGYLTQHQSLSNYVTLNSAQSISGAKTFSDNVYITGVNSTSSNSKMLRFGTSTTTYAAVTANTSNQLVFNAGGTNTVLVGPKVIRPLSGKNDVDLGDTTQAWNNLYLRNKIYKGSYNYTLPSKTGTIALTSDIPSTASNINGQYDEQDVATTKFVVDYVADNIKSKTTTTIFSTLTSLDTNATSVGTFKTKTILLNESVMAGDKIKVYLRSNGSGYETMCASIIEFELFNPISGKLAGSGTTMPTSGDQKFLVSASISENDLESKSLTITTYTMSASSGAPAGVNNVSIMKVERIR